MKCPGCGEDEDKVIESRQNASGTEIRRRRECLRCGYRFTSYERIDEKKIIVVKRDGRREAYDAAKLERGIRISMEKRPIPVRVIDEMLREVEEEAAVLAKTNHEISSKDLGEIVLKKLFAIDRVAYVRFASVYRMFDNVDEFIREIREIGNQNGGDGER